MPWTYEFIPDAPGSTAGTARVTFTDDASFKDVPFHYSHRLELAGAKAANDAARLKAEIEAARDKERDMRTTKITAATALATVLKLKE